MSRSVKHYWYVDDQGSLILLKEEDRALVPDTASFKGKIFLYFGIALSAMWSGDRQQAVNWWLVSDTKTDNIYLILDFDKLLPGLKRIHLHEKSVRILHQGIQYRSAVLHKKFLAIVSKAS